MTSDSGERVAIVTSGSGGIGQVAAERLAVTPASACPD